VHLRGERSSEQRTMGFELDMMSGRLIYILRHAASVYCFCSVDLATDIVSFILLSLTCVSSNDISFH